MSVRRSLRNTQSRTHTHTHTSSQHSGILSKYSVLGGLDLWVRLGSCCIGLACTHDYHALGSLQPVSSRLYAPAWRPPGHDSGLIYGDFVTYGLRDYIGDYNRGYYGGY